MTEFYKNTKKVKFLFLALVCIGIGCSNSTDDRPVLTGQFVDSPVQGLRYTTNSLSGTTNELGEFSYRDGEQVEFFLGELSLGLFDASSTITPFADVDSNQTESRAINVIRLLQTLDADADLVNGIDVRSAVALDSTNQLRLFDLDLSFELFGQSAFEFSVIQALSDQTELITLNSALEHISTQLQVPTIDLVDLRASELRFDVNLDPTAIVPEERGEYIISDGSDIGKPQSGLLNGYGAQTINVFLRDGTSQSVDISANQSAEAIADRFAVIEGVETSSLNSFTIPSAGFNNISGTMAVTINGVNFQPNDGLAPALEQITSLRDQINESTLLDDVSSYISSNGYLTILQPSGADFSLSISGGLSDSFDIVGSDSNSTTLTLDAVAPLATVGGSINFILEQGVSLSNSGISTPIIASFFGSPFVSNAFDPTDPGTYNDSFSMTVYDSLWAPHVLDLFFVKQDTILTQGGDPNTWQVYVQIDGRDVGDPLIGNEPTQASYSLVFNTDGSINRVVSEDVLISNWVPVNGEGDPNGADGPQNVANGGVVPIPYPATSSNFQIITDGWTQVFEP